MTTLDRTDMDYNTAIYAAIACKRDDLAPSLDQEVGLMLDGWLVAAQMWLRTWRSCCRARKARSTAPAHTSQKAQTAQPPAAALPASARAAGRTRSITRRTEGRCAMATGVGRRVPSLCTPTAASARCDAAVLCLLSLNRCLCLLSIRPRGQRLSDGGGGAVGQQRPPLRHVVSPCPTPTISLELYL